MSGRGYLEFGRDRQEGPSVGFGEEDTKARAGRVGPDFDLSPRGGGYRLRGRPLGGVGSLTDAVATTGVLSGRRGRGWP